MILLDVGGTAAPLFETAARVPERSKPVIVSGFSESRPVGLPSILRRRAAGLWPLDKELFIDTPPKSRLKRGATFMQPPSEWLDHPVKLLSIRGSGLQAPHNTTSQ